MKSSEQVVFERIEQEYIERHERDDAMFEKLVVRNFPKLYKKRMYKVMKKTGMSLSAQVRSAVKDSLSKFDDIEWE